MIYCGIEYGKASFKGVEFFIKPTTNTIGRRKIVNLYPCADEHYIEDKGDKPERWSVTGCFVGEDFRDKLRAAKRIWGGEGSGVFFEPTENRRHNVELDEDVVFTYDDQRVNSVTFTLELIEASNDPYPGLLGGLLGRANGLVDNFISTVSTWYGTAIGGLNQFQDVLTGFEAANEFLFDTTRQTLTGTGEAFVAVIGVVDAAEASTNPPTTAQTVAEIFETAIENNAPISFYQQGSEVRVGGSYVEEVQGELYALTALGYYFEEAAASGVNYSELAAFRERALALKAVVDDPVISTEIDRLICALGEGATLNECKVLDGTHHALVASYKLYGNISRANEITNLSGGVSGCALEGVYYL